mgnify:CR=1 FL=1
MTSQKLSNSSSAELRAMKWFTVTHGLGLAAFVALLGTFFWYLHRIEYDTQRQAMYRDIEWAQQSMRLRWREMQEELQTQAPTWIGPIASRTEATTSMPDFVARHADVAYLVLLDSHRKVQWVQHVRGGGPVANRRLGDEIDDSAGYAAHLDARNGQRPTYSSPFLSNDNEITVELHTPVLMHGAFNGTLAVGISLTRSLTYSLPHEVRARYQLSIIDAGGNTMVSSSPRQIFDASTSYELPLDPPGQGVRLRAIAFDVQPKLIDRTLLAAVIGLSIASVVGLTLLWRSARRRVAAEAERDRLFTLSLDLMAVMRPDGHFVRVNPAFEQVLGDTAADDATLLELMHPDDRERAAAELRRLNANPGAVSAVEFEARVGNSEPWRWLRWSIRRDPEPSTRALYAVAHDTTQRKLAETALAAETAFRRAMDDSMLTGMRAFDMEGRITYVNRAFCQMLGFQEAELVGRRAPFPYWPPDHEANEEFLRLALAGEAPPAGFKTKVRRKDGVILDVRMYVSPLIDSHNRQSGWMTSVTDITEPNRIREELAAAHERFTTVLDELDAAVSVAALAPADQEPTADLEAIASVAGDAAGVASRVIARRMASDAPAAAAPTELLFANRFYRRMFGASGKGHAALIASRPTREEWAAFEVFDETVCRWFEVRTRRIRWVDGNLVQMLVATDVTRRREAEAQHQQQADELQRTSRLVTMGEMASSLAHELNQPLTAINNYCMGLNARVRARLASDQPLDGPELLEMLGKTAAQADRAGKVIRRIREFVKRSEPERRPCDVSTIVADAVGLAEIDAQRHSVRINVELARDLPVLQADPILIEQVLLNLLKNAVDAMRNSVRRELVLTVIRRSGQIEFSVRDTGAGLSAEAREKLFEPFFTTKAEGMGIGLNICRSIIESHQGRLWVDDNALQTDGSSGCTFRFTLPVSVASEAAIARAA